MSALKLVPYESLGPIRFDMDRDEVIRVMGHEGRRFATEGEQAEQFADEGLIVAYAEDGTVALVDGETVTSAGAVGSPDYYEADE